MSLAQEYFKSEKASHGSLVITNLVYFHKSFLQRRMLESLNEDKNHTMGIMIKDARLPHKNASKVTDKAKNYLLLMIELDDLNVTLVQWKSLPTWNPLAQTVIVFMIPFNCTKKKEEDVKAVFEMLLDEGIYYAIAIYQMRTDPYKLIAETWFPYHDDSCATSVDHVFKIHECTVLNPDGDNATEHTIDEFNQDRYPKVPNTLHDCPLFVSAFLWEPFVIIHRNGSTGLEILMLKAITEKMNLKLNFTVLRKEHRTKRITDNNRTGIYADLIQK